MDLSQRSIARQWGYAPGASYDISQNIATKAEEAGYNAIRYPCEQGPGSCIAIIKNWDAILSPQGVVKIPLSPQGVVQNPSLLKP